MALGEVPAAEEILKGVQRDRPGTAEVENNLAVAAMLRGKPEEATGRLRELVRRQPEFADAYFNLAAVLQAQGKNDEARAHWLAYLSRDKSSGWAEQAREQLSQLK